MSDKVRIALDAMGGDHGPAVIVAGAEVALTRHPETEFLFFGNTALIAPLVDARPALKAAAKLVHTDIAVRMEDKPSQALRYGRWKSSMWLAIDAVKKGDADVAVSGGNTGALMAMSKFNLKMLPGIDRPAIAALWPTLRGESVVLDLGASIGADADHLVDLAVMGAAMARILFGLDRPSVGLLNIGVEEAKGLEQVREASAVLREQTLPGLDYHGFVEGNDIGKGTVDVVVTEGFAGNIALKTAEGTARQMAEYLKGAMTRTLSARIGYLFARSAFRELRERMDPRKSNGGVFLGLNGIVIKSHGSTDAEGFAAAIGLGSRRGARRIIGQDHGGARASRQAVPPGRRRSCLVTTKRSVILGCGSYLPAQVLTNSELARKVDTSDDWIVQRTGIHERRIAAPGELTSHMAMHAARAALAHAKVDAQSIDLIVLATSTPDNTFPASAVSVQAELGITHGAAFDLQAVCSGFVFALATADSLLKSGAFSRALVIGAETFSRILDWTDRGTCVLFGDGAGAVVLDSQELPDKGEERGILTVRLRSDGRHKSKLYVDGGPSSTGTVGHLRMEGREVFRHAVAMITDVVEDAFKATGYTAKDIDWFIPHQANKRIIDGSAHKLGIPPDKIVVTVDRHGNTSAASIPLALADAVADRRIKRGDLLLLEAMGGGFTWGAALVRW